MKPNNIWQTPSIPDEGDKDPIALYASIGRALSNWEIFEGHLGLLYVQLITPGGESDAARASYGSLIAFTGRLAMLKAAADVYFRTHSDAELESDFKTLSDQAQKASAQRNRIAHGAVQPHSVKALKVRGYSLIPGYHAGKGRDASFRPEYAFTVEVIDRFGAQFSNLCEPAFDLVAAILDKHSN